MSELYSTTLRYVVVWWNKIKSLLIIIKHAFGEIRRSKQNILLTYGYMPVKWRNWRRKEVGYNKTIIWIICQSHKHILFAKGGITKYWLKGCPNVYTWKWSTDEQSGCREEKASYLHFSQNLKIPANCKLWTFPAELSNLFCVQSIYIKRLILWKPKLPRIVKLLNY